jgi:hypothetical protein
MKKWVFLTGGYFDGTLYSVMDEKHLPNEILLHHYENPRVKMAGITILGITEKGPDDITIVEKYVKPDLADDRDYDQIHYTYTGTVDPANVIQTEDESGEKTLEQIPGTEDADDKAPD